MKARIPVLFAIGALAISGLSGCSVRVETPDPTPEPPSDSEMIRQREALRAQAYASLLDAADPADRDLLTPVASHAARQFEVLGGIWEPWPEGDGPEDLEWTAPTADIAPSPTPSSVLQSLRETTPEVCDLAVRAERSDHSLLFASICMSRTLDLSRLAEALGEDGVSQPPFPANLRSDHQQLARALDAAAYVTDIHGAQAHAAGDNDLWKALDRRAFEFRSLGEEIVRINGWFGTENDPRAPYYNVTNLPDQAAVSDSLARAFIAAAGDSPTRRAMIDAALHFAMEANTEFGALPGIE